MARIVALCLAGFAVSRIAHAQHSVAPEHALPPPIVLEAPPPPELPPREYPRRPFELAAELLIGLPNCVMGSAYNQRCEGVTPGPGLGVTALYRPSPYFGVGGTLSTLNLGFRPASGSGLAGGSADG